MLHSISFHGGVHHHSLLFFIIIVGAIAFLLFVLFNGPYEEKCKNYNDEAKENVAEDEPCLWLFVIVVWVVFFASSDHDIWSFDKTTEVDYGQ